MGLTVLWTDTALVDLEDVFDFYTLTANAQLAKRIGLQIADATLNLPKHPYIGQKEPLLANRQKEYRYIIEGNHKIIYTVEQTEIYIVRVFDCRQNPDKLTV